MVIKLVIIIKQEALIPVLTDYLTICPTEREDVSSRAKVLLETIAQRSSDLALVMVPGAVEKFGAPGEHRTTRINTREHCTMLADVNERCAQAMVEPLIGFLESDDQRDGERVLVSIFKKYPSLRQTIITQGLDNESPNVCERFRTICIDLAQEDDMYVRYIAIAASDCLSSETTFSTANNNDTFSVSSNASMVLEQIIVDYPDIAKHLLPILGMIIFDYAVEEISLECRRISSNDTNLKRSCFLMIEAFRHCPGQRIAMLHKAFAEDRGLQVYNKYIDIFSEFIESYLDEVQPEMIAGCFELLINGRVYLELKIVPGMMGIEPYCIPSGEICGPCYAGESLLKLILRNNSDCHRIVLPGVLESFLNNVKPAEIDGPQNTRTGRKGPRVKVDRRYAAKACIGVLDNLRSANSNFPGLLQPFIEQGGEQEMSLEAVNLLMDVYSNKLDKTFSWGRNEEPSGELLRAFITANPQLGTIVLDYIFNNDPMSWFIGRNSDLPEHIYRTCPELRDRMISEMSRFENLIALLQLWDGEFLDLPSPDASL